MGAAKFSRPGRRAKGRGSRFHGSKESCLRRAAFEDNEASELDRSEKLVLAPSALGWASGKLSNHMRAARVSRLRHVYTISC